jgi:hypothetical protein
MRRIMGSAAAAHGSDGWLYTRPDHAGAVGSLSHLPRCSIFKHDCPGIPVSGHSNARRRTTNRLQANLSKDPADISEAAPRDNGSDRETVLGVNAV